MYKFLLHLMQIVNGLLRVNCLFKESKTHTVVYFPKLDGVPWLTNNWQVPFNSSRNARNWRSRRWQAKMNSVSGQNLKFKKRRGNIQKLPKSDDTFCIVCAWSADRNAFLPSYCCLHVSPMYFSSNSEVLNPLCRCTCERSVYLLSFMLFKHFKKLLITIFK